MKWDIQQNLLAEYKGLSLTGRKKLMSQKTATTPALAQWLRNVEDRSSGVSAESCNNDCTGQI